jgi:hypothetical protein
MSRRHKSKADGQAGFLPSDLDACTSRCRRGKLHQSSSHDGSSTDRPENTTDLSGMQIRESSCDVGRETQPQPPRECRMGACVPDVASEIAWRVAGTRSEISPGTEASHRRKGADVPLSTNSEMM